MGSLEHRSTGTSGAHCYGGTTNAGLRGATRRVRARGRASGRAPAGRRRSAAGRRWRSAGRRAARRSRPGPRRPAEGDARPPRPVLGRTAQVGVRRRDQPDAAGRDRPEEREGGVEPELALEQDVELGEGQRPQEQRLVGPREPGHRGGVVEVGLVGGGQDRARVEQDRHADAAQRGPVGRRPASRRAIERPSSDSRPWLLRPTATNASSGASSCSARYASRAALMTAVLVVRARRRVAGRPVEQVGVGEDRRAMRRHMTTYMTRWRPTVNPCDHPPTSDPPQEAHRGPLRAQPAHPRPDRACRRRVREAGGRQMINHRGPEFAAMLERILTGMKPYFGTTERHRDDHDRRAPAGSRRRSSTRSPPATAVLGVSIGSFGDRFAKIAGIYGADVTKLEVEWGYAAAARRGPRAAPRDARRQGRAADPQRDLDRRHEPDPGARRGHPRGGARRADPRRQRVRPRRRAVRDGRLGRRRRRHRLAEGLDVRAGPGDDRRLAARLDRDGDRDDAALLPRPARASRQPRPTARRR